MVPSKRSPGVSGVTKALLLLLFLGCAIPAFAQVGDPFGETAEKFYQTVATHGIRLGGAAVVLTGLYIIFGAQRIAQGLATCIFGLVFIVKAPAIVSWVS